MNLQAHFDKAKRESNTKKGCLLSSHYYLGSHESIYAVRYRWHGKRKNPIPSVTLISMEIWNMAYRDLKAANDNKSIQKCCSIAVSRWHVPSQNVSIISWQFAILNMQTIINLYKKAAALQPHNHTTSHRLVHTTESHNAIKNPQTIIYIYTYNRLQHCSFVITRPVTEWYPCQHGISIF